MPSNPSALIALIADISDREARARLLHEGALALLAEPAMVDAVADAVVAGDDDEMRAASELLVLALDEARMAMENAAPEGAALIEAAGAALSARDAEAELAPPMRMRLAQIYARADLAPPPFAILTPEIMAAAGEGLAPRADAPDIGALLDEVIRDVGEEPMQVHAVLDEMYAGLPLELAETMVAMTIARPGAVEARLGLYWLLDPRREIRLAAATALLQRAEAGARDPSVGALLPAIRKWIPDDPARTALDAAVRRLMRDGGAHARPRPPTIHRAAASLPDGAGAQSLVAAVQAGGRRAVAMMLLKQGHGVKDAFVIPCGSASEQKRTLAMILDEVETVDVAPICIAEALSRGLGEGLALDVMPAPGLVDMIEFWGPEALIPAPADAEAILAAIGAEESLGRLSSAKRAALIADSAEWVVLFEQSDAWFEDTGPLRAAIARARTPRGRETVVWKHLETRRGWWARIFTASAATLKAQTKPEDGLWLSFACVAQALLEGRSLKRTPIMVDIMAMTLDAFDAREGGSGPGPSAAAPRSELHREIDGLLAGAGMSLPYLQGYLTAFAVSPVMPPAQAWIGPLLGGIDFPGERALNEFLEFVSMNANRVNDEAADPTAVAEAIAALDAGGLRDWAEGFADLVEAVKRAWSTKSLAADDKRVLKDLDAVAEGADGAALRTVLPAWVAGRHALRR